MTRIFNRGELKQVLLAIVASLGEGHGYAIMQELQQRVGHDWRPSPGAIYPALLALEESGLIESAEKDGLRAYRPTEQGRKALGGEAAAPAWQTLANVPAPASHASRWRDCSSASRSSCLHADSR